MDKDKRGDTGKSIFNSSPLLGPFFAKVAKVDRAEQCQSKAAKQKM